MMTVNYFEVVVHDDEGVHVAIMTTWKVSIDGAYDPFVELLDAGSQSAILAKDYLESVEGRGVADAEYKEVPSPPSRAFSALFLQLVFSFHNRSRQGWSGFNALYPKTGGWGCDVAWALDADRCWPSGSGETLPPTPSSNGSHGVHLAFVTLVQLLL
eukprot:2139221-Rhodomonas_salina.1